MRTAGMLLMDTPLPDGRIFVSPTSMLGGGTVSAATPGILHLDITGAAVTIGMEPNLLLRYGMSDDAQQQFGMGAPGSQGFQGAQAQPVTTGQPFTTPYQRSGRPPYPSAQGFSPANARPKGLKPVAVTVAYTVTGGPLTAFNLSLYKTALNVGTPPAPAQLLTAVGLPLQTATVQLVTTPITTANQLWLADPFDVLAVSLATNSGAATLSIYGVYIDVAFNYN
jgi:hypothetical protein